VENVRVGQEVKQLFTVLDTNDLPVSGLGDVDFTKYLLDSDNNLSLLTVTVSGLGSGHYVASYTPDTIGTWFLTVYHSVYFPWGKSGETQVNTYDIDTIGVDIKRLLGLSQENYYLDQVVWNTFKQMTSGRIRVYTDSASVGSDINVLDTYNITATYDSASKLVDYKVSRS
jgi:hypothetical protein